MRAWLAGLALCLLSGCGDEPPGPEVAAASELCEALRGSPFYPERWGACGCFTEALMALPEGPPRLAGAGWMVAELGYPLLAAADGQRAADLGALLRVAGVASAADLRAWYLAYAARVQPTPEVTPALRRASGAQVARACVI